MEVTDVRDGTEIGLGLVIVQGILDAHDGKFKVRSKFGEGSESKVLVHTSCGERRNHLKVSYVWSIG